MSRKKILAKNISELSDLLGVDKQVYYRYRDNKDAPRRRANGYPIEEWRNYLKKIGTYQKQAIAKSANKDDSKDILTLREQLIKKDIELKQLKIDKEKRKLVDRKIANQALIGLTQLYKAQLENLPKRVSSKLRNAKLEKELKKYVDEILRDTIDKVRKI